MWLYFALLSAAFNGVANVARRTHGSLAQPAELCWWSFLFSLPLSVGLLLTTKTPYYTSHNFIAPIVLMAFLNTIASISQFRAYKLADASLVSPIANLLPLLLVGTSFLMLGVLPGWGALVGIVLVVCGVYYSSVNGKHKLVNPIKQIFKNPGSRAMLLTVFIWSICNNLEKIVLRSASPAFVLVVQGTIMFSLLSVYLLLRPEQRRLKRGERIIRRWGWHIVAISVFALLSIYFEFQAVARVSNPSYVLAVKRLDVLITILFAGMFLREKHILKRFEGSLVAVAGVILIVLFS